MSTVSTDCTVTFVDEQAAKVYECGICLGILRDAVAVCDDHMFCQTCIHGLIEREGDEFRCPNCRKQCNIFQIKRNKFIDRRIEELMIKCPNAFHTENENESKQNEEIKLCEWNGPWRDLEIHINQCPLHIIPCGFCKELFMRKNVEKHYEICSYYPVECIWCNSCIAGNAMDHHIDKQCDKKIVICNKCNREMTRTELRIHDQHKLCMEHDVYCEYRWYGCHQKIKRKDLNKHYKNKMSDHLKMVKIWNDELQIKVNDLEGKVKDLESKVEYGRRMSSGDGEYGRRIEGLENNLNKLLSKYDL